MNNKGISDLTTGNIKRQMIAFFIPMLLTNMLQQVYNFVDTLIVGKGLGDHSLAAVGNMGSLFFFIVGFSMGLANGFGILIAQSYGAKDYKLLRRNMAATIELAIVLTVILTVVSIVALPTALCILKTDELIVGDCLKYGYIVFGGLFSSIMYNVSAFTLRALGDSRTPLYAIIVSSVVNVVLDSLFIFVLHTGVEGAAVATVIAQILSALVCIRKLGTIDFIRLSREDIFFDGSRYVALLRNGLPMAFMNSITAMGIMVVQSFVNGLGVNATSAYSVCSRYINLFMNPACTAGQTMSSFAGQNYGAAKYDRIREGLRFSLLIAFVSYVLFGSVMVFGHHALSSFLLEGEEAIAMADSYLPIAGMLLLFVDFLFVYRSAAQGMGFPLLPMMSGVAEMLLRIGTIVLLIGQMGFVATAVAEASDWIGVLLINVFAYYRIFAVLRKKHAGCPA